MERANCMCLTASNNSLEYILLLMKTEKELFMYTNTVKVHSFLIILILLTFLGFIHSIIIFKMYSLVQMKTTNISL